MAKKPKEKKEPKIRCEIKDNLITVRITNKKMFLRLIEEYMDEAIEKGEDFNLTFN